jgi:hypothetical protein
MLDLVDHGSMEKRNVDVDDMDYTDYIDSWQFGREGKGRDLAKRRGNLG